MQYGPSRVSSYGHSVDMAVDATVSHSSTTYGYRVGPYMNLTFDYNHIRARKARFARLLNRSFQRTLLKFLAIGLIIIAGLLL